jgi:anti-sigma B factor antagonist
VNGFEITIEALNDGSQVLSVEGELDLGTAAELKRHLLAAISSRPPAVIVDLTRCCFIDSSGLNVLVKGNKHLDGAAPLKLVIPNPDILTVFEITALDAVFAIHSTRAAATSTPSATVPAQKRPARDRSPQS